MTKSRVSWGLFLLKQVVISRLHPLPGEVTDFKFRFISSLPWFQKSSFVKVGHSNEKFQETSVESCCWSISVWIWLAWKKFKWEPESWAWGMILDFKTHLTVWPQSLFYSVSVKIDSGTIWSQTTDASISWPILELQNGEAKAMSLLSDLI